MGYPPLDYPTADALERDLLEIWKREALFRQTLERGRDGEPFVFHEGPPTANGRPGIHHVFARTIKDMVCRYQAMRGRQVTRIAGWDTHGLAVEIEVEKALGISGKADIERYGVAGSTAGARGVFTYKANSRRCRADRLLAEYDRAYATYTKDYIESVWWVLARLYERGLLVEGHKVLPYCPRCGTALSSHELALGYATHKSPSIHVLFPLAAPAADGRPRHLLVWTTTPWTLSNVAVAVIPIVTWAGWTVPGSSWSGDRGIEGRSRQHGTNLGEFPCSRHSRGGTWWIPSPTDRCGAGGSAKARVVAGEFVTSGGHRPRHIAPAFGAGDYAVGQREGLEFVNPVDPTGRFADTAWEPINGRTVFEANPVIAQRLTDEAKLFGRYEPEGYEHTYPFCWRCDSPLIYYARRSWFVRTTAYHNQMLAINRKVR
jgi:isoleucyl-tRNA synthetase